MRLTSTSDGAGTTVVADGIDAGAGYQSRVGPGVITCFGFGSPLIVIATGYHLFDDAELRLPRIPRAREFNPELRNDP